MNWRKYARWLLLFYGFVVTFTIILPIVLWEKPYSAFDLQLGSREELKQTLLLRNRQKHRVSNRYIKNLKEIQNHSGNRDCQLSIGIVSVSRMYDRHTLGYLTQVMHHLHQETLNTNTCISICDVHAGPGNHTEAKKLAPYFHTFTRFPEPSASHVIMDVFEREKEDYTFCLEKLLVDDSEEILLLEDDAVPINGFSKTLRQMLDGLTDKTPNWGYLKLFYPLRWQGYSYELLKLKELTFIGLTGALLFLQINCIIAKITNYRPSICRILLSHETVVVLMCGFLYTMSVALCIGRQNILEVYRYLGYYYTVPAPDCCSPAILYRHNVSQMLVDHFRNTTCSPHYPLDKALDSFRTTYGIDAYLVEPSLVWHIGLVSTLKGVSRHLDEFLFY